MQAMDPWSKSEDVRTRNHMMRRKKQKRTGLLPEVIRSSSYRSQNHSVLEIDPCSWLRFLFRTVYGLQKKVIFHGRLYFICSWLSYGSMM
jgi:hypothetical protein